MTYHILTGDNRDTLKTLADNSVDAIVTDPPYGISFLGKDWDSFRNSKVTKNSTVKNLGSGMRMTTKEENINFQLWCEDWARECLRVLKPGGYMLSFCAARMYHRMTVGLEDAGFEIRDQIMWIYSSGFPKSQDVGKSIERGEKKRADNALGIKRSINASGPKTNCPKCNKTLNGSNQTNCKETPCDLRDALAAADNDWAGWGTALKPAHEPIALARKPIKGSIKDNCVKYGTGALNIDATRVAYVDIKDMESAGLNWNKTGYETGGPRFIGSGEENTQVDKSAEKKDNINAQGRFPSNVIGEIAEPYQKYFYCPKVGRKERHAGHETPPAMFGGMKGAYDDSGHVGNNHPTVKPVELMKYLIKLVTPPGGTVLDPFNGSGSTGMAAVELGYNYIGCELDPAYVDIAMKRIEAWNKDDSLPPSLFE